MTPNGVTRACTRSIQRGISGVGYPLINSAVVSTKEIDPFVAGEMVMPLLFEPPYRDNFRRKGKSCEFVKRNIRLNGCGQNTRRPLGPKHHCRAMQYHEKPGGIVVDISSFNA